MYAILGASGKVGFATCTALRKAGKPVRAILHDASKADRLRDIGCEIAVAEICNLESLTAALSQADAVQIILPLNPMADDPPADMRKAFACIADVLESTCPRRFLLISDYGAHVAHDIGMPSIFHSFEKRLSQLSGHKLFLRSAEHMENWVRSVPLALASGSLHTFHDPIAAPFATISAGDVGSISAELLLSPFDGSTTQVIHAEGPRRYNAKDVAAALSEILNRVIVVNQIPRSQWESVLTQGTSLSLANLLIKTNDAHNAGGLIDSEPGATELRHGTTELKDVLQAQIHQ